ncbi:MAG: bifunctional UDP-N-acetylglucosamine diphosphorylase/glucosamine-1-phosphate N-acetyltransferase GlmU [Acutalibacteraceae bacterium]
MIQDCAIILAAGEGTRMKSAKPKVLAEVLFKPMLDWVIDRTRKGGVENLCVVTGHLGDVVREHLGNEIETVEQAERLGTGHAVAQAKDFILRHSGGNVLVLAGDAPLVDSQTIEVSLNVHKQSDNAATVITSKVDNPHGYGRILRSSDGTFERIVEEREANEKEKKIDEVNSGAYWFKAQALLVALERLETFSRIPGKSKNKEYYLTDTLEILNDMNQPVNTFSARTPQIVLGANDRIQLAQLNEIARREELERHMVNGVSIPCDHGIIIGPDVEIGADTLIMPGTIIRGRVKIGIACTIGPNSFIEDSTIGDRVTLNNVQCFSSVVEDDAQLGPFVRLRPGSRIEAGALVGNFVEIKNSVVGEGTKISHLSYVGDSQLGKDVNVGSGCATVNFNGKDKQRCVIQDGAFLGCHTALVAPVTVGKNAYTAAGSVITEDVPDNALAIARSRQVNKKGWVDTKKPYRRQHQD